MPPRKQKPKTLQPIAGASQLSADCVPQPAANTQDADASQPSGPCPAIAAILQEVLVFGRIPKQVKKPSTEEERKEKLLAQRLSSQRKFMTEENLQQLDELAKQAKDEAATKRKAAKNEAQARELMDEFRKLGHYPRETENKEPEFAQRLRKARKAVLFQPADEAELAASHNETVWTTQRENEAEQVSAQMEE